jgi:LysM repeat protein
MRHRPCGAVVDRPSGTGATLRRGFRPTLAALAAVACGLVPVACSSSSHRASPPTSLPAPTTTVPPTTTTVPAVRYQVKAGDTLSGIAIHFHVTEATIVAANRLANANQLTVGQMLTIPVPPPPPAVSPGTPGSPAVQPAALAISPAAGPAGQVFDLKLSGAKPGETVTFLITGPDGSSFTGPPHAVPAGGAVSTSYATSEGDAAGQYQVAAKNGQGTVAQAAFQLTETTTTGP